MTPKAGHTFTAGPWRAERTRNGDYRIVYNKTGNWLAEVHADGEPEVEKADASLIAAAPELLEALQGLIRFTDAVRVQVGMGKTQLERLDKARAAIAKATAGGAV